MRALSTLVIILSTFCSATASVGWSWSRFSMSHGLWNETEPVCITTDKAGNAIVAGYFLGDTLNMNGKKMPNPRNMSSYLQLFILKENAAGTCQWAIGSTGPGTEALPSQIATDAQGNIIVYGYYNGASFTIGDTTLYNPGTSVNMGFLLKISPAGIVLWARNINTAMHIYAGNMVGLGIDGESSIYITGDYSADSIAIGSTVLHSAGASDIFIAKYSSAGTPLWASDIGNENYNMALCFAVAPGGNSYLCLDNGSADTLIVGSSVVDSAKRILVKYDKDGHPAWAKKIDYLCNYQPRSMALDQRENIYMAGTGEYIADALVNQTFTLAKYSAHGDSVWASSIPSNWGSKGYSVSVDSCGNLWACGAMGTTFGFPLYTMSFPGDTLRSTGNYDPLFIARYDTSGAYISRMSLTTGGDDESAIAVDYRGNFYIAGDVIHANALIGPNYFLYPGTGEYLYVAKYHYLDSMCKAPPVIDSPHWAAGIAAVAAGSGITVFPNPAGRQFTISVADVFAPGARVLIYDAAGHLVKTSPLSGNSTTIPADDLANGLHELMIYNGDEAPVIEKLTVIN